MDMWTVMLAAGLFVIGLYLTMKGGDSFVDAAALIAEASGVPRFVIGATIVSLCTTAPELTVSLLATARGTSALAVGNAVGSSICNTALILGLGALLAPAALSRREACTKGGLMLAATAAVGLMARDGALGARDSLLLIALLALFLWMGLQSAAQARKQQTAHVQLSPADKLKTGGRFVLGAAAVVIGAKLMVDNGVVLARFLGVPESVIGLTLVALGTSLPELITAVAAIRRGEGALSAGNIIGANIVDLTLVLPACAGLAGGALPVEAAVSLRDAPAALLVMVIAIVPPMFSGRLRRVQGAALLVCYAVYVALLMGVF